MTFAIILVAIIAVVLRWAILLKIQRKINYSPADESVYAATSRYLSQHGLRSIRRVAGEWLSTPSLHQWPPPVRVLWLVWGAVYATLSTRVHRGLAVGATLAGSVLVVVATAMAWRLYGPVAALGTAALVGSSPLLLGLGRRALIDVPAACAETIVLTVVCLGVRWWPALVVALVLMLLLKESTRTFLAPMAGWTWWLWGDLVAVGVVFGAAWVLYELALWGVTGARIWTFRRAARDAIGTRGPQESYGSQYCRGGLHRLIVDLVLVSPLVVLATVHGRLELVGLALSLLLPYASPRLSQQLRTVAVVDVVLRMAAASVLPWWLLPVWVAADLWLWYRVWVRGQLYDPTTMNLTVLLEMGPRK